MADIFTPVFKPLAVGEIVAGIRAAGLTVHRVTLEDGGQRLIIDTSPLAQRPTGLESTEFDALDFTHGQG